MANGLALVTGAASGMGKGCAKVLAEAGWELVLCDMAAGKLEEVAAELPGNPTTLVLDLTAPDLASRLDAALAGRKLGGVVHCAGISPTMAGPEKIMAVNLAASTALMDALETRMAQGGSVVLFASNSAHMIGPVIDDRIAQALESGNLDSLVALSQGAAAMAYGISKRGVMVLARREAIRKAAINVRVNSLSPGIIETPMALQEMEQQPAMPIMIEQSPARRMGRPEEIGAVVRFLLSDQSSFVIGTDILVDGGEMTAGFVMPVAGISEGASGFVLQD